jgi:endonuclease-3
VRNHTCKEQLDIVIQITEILKGQYPSHGTELNYSNGLDLLVATILSAQCTDVRVNIVTKQLFNKNRNAGDYLAVPLEELENDIRSTGFFHNKARSIKGACQMLLQDFNGKVPGTMGELLRLPGVGRKTANCVLGNYFGKSEGIVVDTHVLRLTKLIGLTSWATPEKVEQELMKIVPRTGWISFSNLLIQHGRKICIARRPDCQACKINHLYKFGINRH